MKQPLLNDQTAMTIKQFIGQPHQSVGLFAAKGSGKYTIAIHIAEQLMAKNINSNNPDLFIVRPTEKPAITIDQVREAIQFLKLKGNFGAKSKRVIIVEQADKLTRDAQNAFLKTLEEPTANSVIIMTASDPSLLLPTIVSRLRIIHLHPLTYQQINEYFSPQYSAADIKKTWLISGGRLGLMSALLNNNKHDLLDTIVEAKQFLANNTYQRLAMVDSILKQDTHNFLDALQLTADSAFKQIAQKSTDSQLIKWHKIRLAIHHATEALSKNANTKLTLTNLILSL